MTSSMIATLILAAQTAGTQQCEPPRPAEAAAAVRALNQEYIDAARTHDAPWFRRHMAEDVVVVLSSGRRLRKPDFLTMLKDERKSYRSLTVHNVTVRVFGPAVQVDADAPWELADSSKGVSRYIDSYAWLDCRWQVISAQITLLSHSGS
jgi:hypothetical protein